MLLVIQVDIMLVRVVIQVNNHSVMDHMKELRLRQNDLKLANLEPITFVYVNTAKECPSVTAPILNLSTHNGIIKQYHFRCN